MNETEARIFREAYTGAAVRYSKMTTAQLQDEDDAACQYAGIEHVFGGPVTKAELITDIMNLRGYTTAKWDEATHVIAHETPWPDCEHCQAAAAFVPSGTGWPVA